jgi:RNA polymerase sigma-B factor
MSFEGGAALAYDEPHRRSPPNEAQLLQSLDRDNSRARERLIEHHMPLARRLAARYRHSGEALDDLIQVACLGLIKAIDRYDPAAGPFPRFAVPTITGELKRHFRDKGWAMRVPRDLQERAMSVGDAIDHLATELGRSPTARDVARFTSLSLEDVLEAMDAASAYTPMSLDSPKPGSEEDDDHALVHHLGGEDPGFVMAEWRPMVAPAVRALPAREREILRLRFAEDMTQTEIADRIGISQMHVSRLLRRSLDKLTRATAGVAAVLDGD